MPLLDLDEDVAAAAIGEVRAARGAARERAQARLTRSRERLRSATKTRKSAATRARIMEAASQLMVEHGGTNFQMGEVSERCGMSKGSLYYYFADKDELVEAIFADLMDRSLREMERVVAEAPTAGEALAVICSEFLSHLGSGSPLALAITSELSGGRADMVSVTAGRLSRTVDIISSQLRRAQDEGLIREDIDCDLAATYVTGGFLLTSLASVSLGAFADHVALSDELVALALAGIGRSGQDSARNAGEAS